MSCQRLSNPNACTCKNNCECHKGKNQSCGACTPSPLQPSCSQWRQPRCQIGQNSATRLISTHQCCTQRSSSILGQPQALIKKLSCLSVLTNVERPPQPVMCIDPCAMCDQQRPTGAQKSQCGRATNRHQYPSRQNVSQQTSHCILRKIASASRHQDVGLQTSCTSRPGGSRSSRDSIRTSCATKRPTSTCLCKPEDSKTKCKSWGEKGFRDNLATVMQECATVILDMASNAAPAAPEAPQKDGNGPVTSNGLLLLTGEPDNVMKLMRAVLGSARGPTPQYPVITEPQLEAILKLQRR